MSASRTGLVIVATLLVAGCASQTQMLDSQQELAIKTALTRARFEMQCPKATAVVLSREMVQPAVEGPLYRGEERAEYTIGVSGCNKRSTYVVICPEGGDGCFAAVPQSGNE